MDWLKILPLIALLPHLLYAIVQGQSSSCSEYFTYMSKSGITDMLGQIEVRPPSANDTFILKVALNTITEWPSQVAGLELARSIQESLGNVHQGKPLLYHVYYRLTDEPIPSVSAIWFNDKQYCPSSEVSGNITATIELGHILYPSNEEPLLYNYGPWQLNSLPWHRNSSTYRIDNPNYDRLNYESALNNECGITSYYTDETNRLIADGEKTLPGQWPWLVAIYIQRTDNESAYDFECTGSLVTTKHVITERICIGVWNYWAKDISTLVEPQRLYVSFGQFNSNKWHGNQTGIINRAIVDYKLYQYRDYNHNVKRNALVILILKTAVEFNAFIKPVCLWSGSTDLQDIVNMTGYVVGWGRDLIVRPEPAPHNWEFCTGEPRMAKVPLMNLSVNSSDENVFIQHNTTTVVEINNNTRRFPLYIDNGGGLVIFNTTTGRYQLRGVKYDYFLETQCIFNAKCYIDVAKQISWIRQQIFNT